MSFRELDQQISRLHSKHCELLESVGYKTGLSAQLWGTAIRPPWNNAPYGGGQVSNKREIFQHVVFVRQYYEIAKILHVLVTAGARNQAWLLAQQIFVKQRDPRQVMAGFFR